MKRTPLLEVVCLAFASACGTNSGLRSAPSGAGASNGGATSEGGSHPTAGSGGSSGNAASGGAGSGGSPTVPHAGTAASEAGTGGQGLAGSSASGGRSALGSGGIAGTFATGGATGSAGTGGLESSGGTASCKAEQLKWGVNVHDGGGDPTALAAVMSSRHLTSARMDLYANDGAYFAKFQTAVAKLTARGIGLEAIVFDKYSPGNPQSQNCSADLAQVETDAYGETLSQVRAAQGIVTDFELMNEVPLSANIKLQGATGESASDYDVACGRMQAANLRGMSRAVVDERTRTGRPLRIILGTTDRSFGFLSFMEREGVTFDVVGYHIYPWESHAALDLDPWFGSGGPLGQLARFKRPIHINEFNCGEIYSGSPVYPDQPQYENKSGAPVTEACLRSVAKHLLELTNQSVAQLESVHFYEMWDEPTKSSPENHFGLTLDLATPKVNLFLASAFSGGTLAAAESAELTSRGLLSSAQIANWSPCGAGPGQ